jgi:hypothetical protein
VGENISNLVRKPVAGESHTRFDERDLETEPWGHRARSRLYPEPRLPSPFRAYRHNIITRVSTFIGAKIIVRRFDRLMAFVPEGQADRSQARSAWVAMQKAPSRRDGRSVQSSRWDGAIFLMIPGTSCLATIVLSLRDKNHSPSDQAPAGQ